MWFKSLCTLINPEKNYCDIAKHQLYLGNKIVSATIIAAAACPVSATENIVLNRILDAGSFNVIQQSFLPVKITNYKNYTIVENPVYRGVFHANRALANWWTQNSLKLASTEKTLNFINSFEFSLKGMSAFYVVLTTESKTPGPYLKIAYTTMLSSSFLLTSYFYSSPETKTGQLNSLLLNFKDTALLYVGGIASFTVLDIAQETYNHLLADKVTLPTDDQLQINLNTIAISFMAYKYLQNPQGAISLITLYLTLPLARSLIFTGAEITSDLIGLAASSINTETVFDFAKLAVTYITAEISPSLINAVTTFLGKQIASNLFTSLTTYLGTEIALGLTQTESNTTNSYAKESIIESNFEDDVCTVTTLDLITGVIENTFESIASGINSLVA